MSIIRLQRGLQNDLWHASVYSFSTLHNYVHLKYNNKLGPCEKQDGYSLCFERFIFRTQPNDCFELMIV